MELVNKHLSSPKFTQACSSAYTDTVRSFFLEHVAQKLSLVRKSHGMFDALEREDEWDEDTDLTLGASGE